MITGEMFTDFAEWEGWTQRKLKRVKDDLRNVFAALRLPEPRSAEYMGSGPGNLAVVFLYQAGCVLRIVKESDYPLYRHPNLMRPIGSVKLADGIRLDVQYAGECPVSEADIDKADKRFTQTHLAVGDVHENNFCRIRAQNLTFPEGVPIMFDPLGIYDLTGTAGKIKRFLGLGAAIPRVFKGRIVDFSPLTGEKPDDQDVLFADLREKFKAMFDDAAAAKGEIKAKPEAVQAFWAAMIEATQQGRLHPSWMDCKDWSTAKSRGIDILSQNYAGNLAEHNPAFAEYAKG